MTDFVDRLLGRSALAPIRPLLPTLFEPSARGDTDDALPMETFTTSPERGHDAEPASVVQLFAPQPTQAPSAEPATPAAHEAQTASAAVQNRTESPPVPSRHRAAPTSPHSEPVPRHRATAAPVDTRTRMDPEPPRRVAVAASPAAPLPGRASESPGQRPTPPAGVDRSAQRPKIFQQNVVRSLERAREPDVHISIGRVEITAAPPSTPPPRRVDATRRPQLTLDDYLKSREG